MMNIIRSETPSIETIEAIEEVQRLKANPHKKTYDSFAELLEDLDNELDIRSHGSNDSQRI